MAAGEYIGPWGKLQSILAVEELTGMLALHQAIPLASRQLDPATFRLWKKGLAQEMARLVRELHRRRSLPQGPLPVPFLHRPRRHRPAPEWRGRVFMIDFHRLGRHLFTWPIWLVKDLGQLLYSSHVEGVDARDRLWFWRCY